MKEGEVGHKVGIAVNVITGIGFTVMVYDAEVPVHPLAEGVTEIDATMGEVLVFVAVNAGILPVPLAANPIAGLELVHVKVAPGVVLVKVADGIIVPVQTFTLPGMVTTGVGFTVIVYVELIPRHPLAEGVIVIVAVIGAELVLTALNPVIFPVPLADKPIVVLLFVQV